MDSSKYLCAYILIFIVISSQAEARLFKKVEPPGELSATKGDDRRDRKSVV